MLPHDLIMHLTPLFKLQKILKNGNQKPNIPNIIVDFKKQIITDYENN